MSGELPSDVNPYEIEPQLSAYAPRPARIDRDRLMFEAGRAAAASHPSASAALALRPGVIAWFPPSSPSAPPTNWMWPASTLALGMVSVVLGLVLLFRPEPLERVQVVERVVNVPVHAPAAFPQPLAVSSGITRPDHDVPPLPAAEEEAPAIALESLPEDHFLRVRQTALTQGVEWLAPPARRETARLSPAPTRGKLMRQLAAPPAAAATQSTGSSWSLWFSAGRPAM